MSRSIITAIAIAVAAAGWILSGQFDLFAGDDRQSLPVQVAAVAERPAEPAVSVRAREMVAEPHTLDVVVRGRTEAVRSVVVKAEIQGRLVEIIAAEGTRVAAGAVLARIAVEDRQARLVEARALVRQREIESAATRALSQKGFRTETQVAAAAANLDAAMAILKRYQINLGQLTVKAPFAGVVERRDAELGDFVQEGDPVALIVDDDPILVVGQVSERDVGKLGIGRRGRAELVNGERLVGTIRYIATTAEPATRTFRVELEVANGDHALRDGVTAEIRLESGTVMAHFVSPAVLTLDDTGRVGVRSVDEAGRVHFRAAEVIGDSADGVWLAGLPERLTLITVGQEFVREGETVGVVLVQTEPAS